MRYAQIISLLIVLCSSSAAFAGGIVMGATRIIYDAAKKETAITVENRNSGGEYLVQAWVDDANENKNTPFIVTPPLFRLADGKQNMLRIIRAGGSLPEDRESVYWLNVKAIPPAPADSVNNSLQIAIKTRMKLFYRPAGLSGKPTDAYSQLVWKVTGNQLQITNPSPYSVVLGELTIAGKQIKETKTGVLPMIPAKGIATLTLPTSAAPGAAVVFKAINDYGGSSDAVNASLQ